MGSNGDNNNGDDSYHASTEGDLCPMVSGSPRDSANMQGSMCCGEVHGGQVRHEDGQVLQVQMRCHDSTERDYCRMVSGFSEANMQGSMFCGEVHGGQVRREDGRVLQVQMRCHDSTAS